MNDNSMVIITIIGLIVISTITFRISANVNTDAYFKNSTLSERDATVVNI